MSVIGVDPVGSTLAHPETLDNKKSEYKVEGIGYDFVPSVLEQRTPDPWVKTTDQDSFRMASRLVHEEDCSVVARRGQYLQV